VAPTNIVKADDGDGQVSEVRWRGTEPLWFSLSSKGEAMAAHELCGLMCLEGGLPGAYQGLRHLGHPASKVLRCSPRHVRPENLRSSNELARGGRIYSPSGSLSRPARCSGGSWSGSSRQGTGSTMSSQV